MLSLGFMLDSAESEGAASGRPDEGGLTGSTSQRRRASRATPCNPVLRGLFSDGLGPRQKRSRPMAAPTMIVTTDSTSMGTKKLWSNNLPPSLVVPVRSKLAAAIWVPLAGSV